MTLWPINIAYKLFLCVQVLQYRDTRIISISQV